MNLTKDFILVMMLPTRLVSKVKYLYVLILIFYTFFFAFYRPRPKLSSLFIKGSNSEFLNHNTKKNKYNVIPPSNNISLGKSFLIKDNKNWYYVIQLSFWRKEYLNLNFLRSQLKITDLKVKSINGNNYASGTLQGEEIVYSCMKNSSEFYYSSSHGIVLDSLDIKHWIKVYIKNLNFVFYSFKPKNYECYVVLTQDKNFFENSKFEINKKIFNNFNYE